MTGVLDPTGYTYGTVLPFRRHNETGVLELAVPTLAEYLASGLLPLRRDAAGNFHVDWSAGLPGAIWRAVTAPGDAYAGRLDPLSAEGRERVRSGVDAAVGRAGEPRAARARGGLGGGEPLGGAVQSTRQATAPVRGGLSSRSANG